MGKWLEKHGFFSGEPKTKEGLEVRKKILKKSIKYNKIEQRRIEKQKPSGLKKARLNSLKYDTKKYQSELNRLNKKNKLDSVS